MLAHLVQHSLPCYLLACLFFRLLNMLCHLKPPSRTYLQHFEPCLISQASKPRVWAWVSQHLCLVGNSRKLLALSPSAISQEVSRSQPGISPPPPTHTPKIPFPTLILAFNKFFPYFHFFFLDYRKVFVSTKPDLALLRNIFLTDSCLLVLMFILVNCSKHEIPISKGFLKPALVFVLLWWWCCFVFNIFCIILPKLQTDPVSCQDLL